MKPCKGQQGRKKKTREKFLAILHQQAERIFRLATDQLSLARIEQTEHQIPQDECDLSVICSRVMTSLQNHAEKAKITLKFQPSKAPLIIRGNQDELVQMVQNLVENGIRYGRPNGEVSITLTQEVKYRAAPQTRFCCIKVRDTGEGIDKMHLPRLTERFFTGWIRTDRAPRAEQGWGWPLLNTSLAIIRVIWKSLRKLAWDRCFASIYPCHKTVIFLVYSLKS